MAWADKLVVLTFLTATLAVGIARGRKFAATPRRASYLLAGRRLSLPAFVATMVSTWYGGILGVGEYGFRFGLSSWLVFGVPYYLAAGLFAVLLARRARAAEVQTLPEQIRGAYGAGPGSLAAALVLVTSVPAAYVLTLGVLLQAVFDIPVALGVVLGTVFSVAYLWRGGFAAVVRTDVLQFALMFGGFALLLGWLVASHGFAPFLQDNVPATHWTWHGGRPAQAVLVWYVIALATLVEPSFYQRCYAARSPAVARNGLLLSILCWAVFDAMTTSSALYARALLADLPAARAAEAFPLLAQHVLPVGLLGIFFVGLFATVMSTVDSYLFVAASIFGRDMLAGAARFRGRQKTATRIGLIVAAVLAIAIALSSRSVVRIWHTLGTVSTCTLLLPTVGAFVPRLRMTPRGAMVHMGAVLVLTTAWLASPWLSEGGGYWFGVEPIYAGLVLGGLIWLSGFCCRRVGFARGSCADRRDAL